MAKTIAKGAAGVALTAGVVAAGAALSDKRTRSKITKGAGKAIKTISTTAQKGIDQASKSQAFAHTIRPSKTKQKTTTAKTAKKK